MLFTNKGVKIKKLVWENIAYLITNQIKKLEWQKNALLFTKM